MTFAINNGTRTIIIVLTLLLLLPLVDAKLLTYLPLDRNIGSYTPDSALGLTNCWSNNSNIVNGLYNKSFEFVSNQNRMVTCNSSNNYNGSAGFTMELWIKTNVTNCGDNSDGYEVLGFTEGGVGTAWMNLLKTGCKPNSYMINESSTTITIQNSTINFNVPKNVWTYLALAYNSTSKYANLYVNGSKYATVYVGVMNWDTTKNMTVGKRARSMLFDFNGSIDEVKFYNDTKDDSYFNSAYYAFTNSLNNADRITEGQYTSYLLTVNYPRISTYNVTAWLTWNGTSKGYAVRTDTNLNQSVFNISFTIPQINSFDFNNNIEWNYNITETETYAGYNFTQRSSSVRIGACDWNEFNRTILNLTFKDESTMYFLNATLSSSWTYGLFSRTLSFQNTTANSYYSFCISPSWAGSSVSSVESFQYANTGYPSRTVYYNNDLFSNSSTTSRVFYMLGTSSGIYSSFQTVNQGSQVVSGVQIVLTTTVSGNSTTVCSGTTDSSGILTCWLNPTQAHSITASKTGYSTYSSSITPTQSLYTITMSGSDSTGYYTYLLEGMKYYYWPNSGPLNRGQYNFTFQIEAGNNPIDNCTMSLTFINGTELFSATNCTATGGYVNALVDINRNTTILIGRYSVGVNNTVIVIESDARWIRWDTNASAFYTSMRYAINESISMKEWGSNPETNDFSRIVFFFIFFGVLLAGINFFTGYDTAYPGAFIYIMWGVVGILTFANGFTGPGYFYLYGYTSPAAFGTFGNVINNMIVFIVLTLLSLIYYFSTARRYQS